MKWQVAFVPFCPPSLRFFLTRVRRARLPWDFALFAFTTFTPRLPKSLFSDWDNISDVPEKTSEISWKTLEFFQKTSEIFPYFSYVFSVLVLLFLENSPVISFHFWCIFPPLFFCFTGKAWFIPYKSPLMCGPSILYKDFCEGCESKKCKIGVVCAHARVKDRKN